jgi:phosphotransferase system enzyme I (PtsI)
VAQALRYNCEGIGLLRTEFLYLHRRRLPGEEEQFEHLRAIIEQMGDHIITIRTLDLGGEKLLSAEEHDDVAEANSLLGLRAIRLCLAHPEIFRPQLRAILRASAFGNVRILLPMVSRLRDVTATRALLAECAEDLQAQGYTMPDRLPPLGVMIEVPAAALIAEELAEQVDFFSIGTNDLTMYTLAVDRGDERMLDYYQPRHNAVLKLIEMTVTAADRRGIPVSVCGEMAADTMALETLLRLGIREVSVAPPSLLPVKDKIRQLHLA